MLVYLSGFVNNTVQQLSHSLFVMAYFSLTSTWQVPASIESCWFCLLDKERWPEWWPYVDRVEQLRQGATDGVGNICRYHWHTCLPYRLIVDITIIELIPFQTIRYTASGDLRGYGACRLHGRTDGTTLLFDWNVQTNKSWMNATAAIAAPIFSWNHRRVMKKGEQSFIQRLYSGP